MRLSMHVAECLLDVALVVDCTDMQNWQYVIDFMVDLVSAVNVGKRRTHVGAVTLGKQLQEA